MQYRDTTSLCNVKNSIVVVVGATAVGKTDISIQLAKRINGEIVSADSRLFYRGMDIGTAKPSLEQQKEVPHHLINVAEPGEVWSLALFQSAVDDVIGAINRRGKTPLLVGGTGQYIWGVIDGWDLPSQEPDYQLRCVLENLASQIGAERLHQHLMMIDPDAAKIIESGNVRRTIRALEVIFRTGYKFSIQRRKKNMSYSYKMIGLTRPRPELYQRIDERIENMMESGFIQEVETLMKMGYQPEMSALSAIGYKEISSYLKSEITLDEAIVLMKRRTRQYVRRQANWFKESDNRIRWFNPTISSIDEIVDYVVTSQNWVTPDKSISSDQ